MGRFHNQMLAGVVLAGAAVVTSSGCADNESSLFIQGVLAPEPPDCDVEADPSAMFLGVGVLDVALASEYRAWLLVGNQLTAQGRKQQVRTETARVTLRGAEVRLADTADKELASFTVPGTGFVHINRSEEPGYGVFLTTLIPATIGSGMGTDLGGAFGARQTVVASVRVFGDTLGGEELESAELSFPIEICYGCTIVYPLEAIDTNGTCSLAGTDVSVDSCFVGQGPIDCRACANTVEACQSVPGAVP